MPQPQSTRVKHARALVVELGQLLGDLTTGHDVDAVHQRLLDRFDAVEHDRRIGPLELDRRVFADTWSALRDGADLPAAAWERVVLPTVVVFGTAQTVKVYLELATAYWLAARAAVDAVPDYPAAAALAADESSTVVSSTPSAGVPRSAAPRSGSPAAVRDIAALQSPDPQGQNRTGPDRRVLVAVAAAVLVTVFVVLLLVRPGGDPSVPAQAALPLPELSSGAVSGDAGQPSLLPTTPPTASPQPSPVISGAPMPTPTWTPPAPAITTPGTTPVPPVAPSPPRHLTAVAADEHTVWLLWSAPADGGSGGVAFYRVQRDGRFIGWTSDTSVTVTGLAPGTSYTFAVVARNGAGLESVPGNQITVTTALPPPASPSASSVSPPEPSPTSEPSPSPSQLPTATASPADESAVPAE
ncbi:fibronectin type III domain-containing protein [Catellatospora methionotrophica]|uniref:fibronectin type III domain-containing protein n=1 Tax=Catellatospora methionotrophica TaxID=121620 RepID=UPI0033D393E0